MLKKSASWSTGFAIFSMFFGAGNIVFPLALGQFTLDKNIYGVLGMILTAVFVPLIGLMSMLLYEGNYKDFFKRIGTVPGFIVTLLILGLIGPLGGIPRCITISYSTLHAIGFYGFEKITLPIFALISCFVIYFFTFRQNKILPLLGYVLTPLLLISLAIIAIRGIFSMPSPIFSDHSAWQTFSKGFLDGYNTMDLLASFFFSSVVILCLRKNGSDLPDKRISPLRIAIYGSLIAAVLLGLVYVCFSFLAAGFSESLQQVPSHELLGTLAFHLLGPQAGLIAGLTVALACLTTEIALTVVFAEFLHRTLMKERFSYTICVCFTLFCACLMSTLNFTGLSAFLVPILQLFYPALIVLCILNILHKLFGFQSVKPVFYATVAATLLIKLFF